MTKAIEKDEQISAYVSKLESQYEESLESDVIPDPSEVVQDLEQFLRSQHRRRTDDQSL